jgi:hypothetical protein
MKTRVPALGATFLLCVGAGALGLPAAASGASLASASAVSKPKPSPPPSPPPGTPGAFVKAYGTLVNGALLNLSPLDVQATSDGGSIALAETDTPQGLGVDWLVKLNAAGAAQWQEQVGCASPQGAPGDYADGVSVQQTADGGYVVAGGTVDCGSGTSCPPLSGRSRSPTRSSSWARTSTSSTVRMSSRACSPARRHGDQGLGLHRQLILRPDTPLDADVKERIAGQLDSAAGRIAAPRITRRYLSGDHGTGIKPASRDGGRLGRRTALPAGHGDLRAAPPTLPTRSWQLITSRELPSKHGEHPPQQGAPSQDRQ